MKKLLYFIFTLCILLFSSCEKDFIEKIEVEEVVEEEAKESIDDCALEYYYGFMEDGWRFQKIHLQVSSESRECYGKTNPIFADYSKMLLDLGLGLTNDPMELKEEYNLSDNEYWDMIDSLKAYYKTKTLFIQKEIEKYEKIKKYPWFEFITSYTDGDVVITCDKTLFGKSAGENLAQYFKVKSLALFTPHGIDNTTLTCIYDDNAPKTINEFFTYETWLEGNYVLSFDSIPEENYHVINFTITMPIKYENTYKYMINKLRGNDYKLETTKVTTSASFTAKFGHKVVGNVE